MTVATSARTLMHRGPVIPVVVLDDVAKAADLARSLLAGGIDTMEITLRTPAAMDAIRRVADEVPSMLVGAGTVTTPRHVAQAVDAGARFLVSPGSTPGLLDATASAGIPFLPGAVTASEVLALVERGITEMKFFPAASSGGASAVRAFAGPFPDVRFCPTGGIGPGDACDYLRLPNVVCVGGSWLTPVDLIESGNWQAIATLAAQAAAPAPRE